MLEPKQAGARGANLTGADSPGRGELHPALKPIAPLGRAFSDWWRELFRLSLAALAWAALSFTVVGGPPAGAALYAFARATALHEDPGVSLFASTFRKYFLKSWLLALVSLAGILIWVIDLVFYFQVVHDGGLLSWLASILIVYLGTIWLYAVSYFWPLLVCRGDLRLPQLLRNGLLLALRYPLQQLVSFIALVVLTTAGLYMPPLFILVIPPVVTLLGVHNLYIAAPELAPEDVEMLELVV